MAMPMSAKFKDFRVLMHVFNCLAVLPSWQARVCAAHEAHCSWFYQQAVQRSGPILLPFSISDIDPDL